jgi:hypothetical protein
MSTRSESTSTTGKQRESLSSTPGDTSARNDSVGSLLAAIATLISESLRLLSLSDKRAWGPDEHEQVRALEEVLDEARKDFQELGPLVNGQFLYENDRTRTFCRCPSRGFRAY